MINLHLICDNLLAFKRDQICPNRFSHLRGKDVSLVEIDLLVTFSIVSPKPEVAAMIHLHLICGNLLAFKRDQICPNRFSHLREKDVSLVEIDL